MPQSSRRAPQISPTVHRARRASRSGTIRFVSPAAASRTARERARCLVGIALGADEGGALALAALGLGIDPVELDALLAVLAEAVDPDDHVLARPRSASGAERRLLDLSLHEALLDRGDGAADLVDALDQLARRSLELAVSAST